MPSMIYSIKEMARVAYSQSPNVKLVDETTNDDPWGPTCQQMDDVCRTYKMGGETSAEILGEIVLRLENRKDSWRRCYKSLLLLDHMARTLPERQLRDLDRVTPLLSTISRSFYHTDSKGVDQGVNIRERAKKLMALLQDKEHLAAERAKSAATASKVGGLSGGDFGGGGSGKSAGRFSGTGSNVNAVSAQEGGAIANRRDTYGVGVGPGGYDTYVPKRGTASPAPAPASGTTTHSTGRALTREEQEAADMAFAARLQQEEERRTGTRVTDTDIGRRIANEGRAEQEARQQAEWNRKQQELMARKAAEAHRAPAPAPAASSGASAMDAEQRMAMELQARLDRGEDMESAIAALTAKYQPQQQQQQQQPARAPAAAVAVPVPQPQQQVIDPFAAPPQQQQRAGGGELDFFSDIPQGNLVAKNGPALNQQVKPAGSTLDDLFGAPAPQQQQQQQFNTNSSTNGGMDFFASASPPPRPAQQANALDFFGNASPNTTNNATSNNNAFGANDDFFATAPPPATKAPPANGATADPFAMLSQAQQNSIDALSGGQKRQQIGLGQANAANRAQLW